MPHCFGAYWCQASIWTEIFELKSVFFPDHPLATVSMNLITFFVEVLSVYNPDARRPTSSYIGRARASTSTALRLSLPNLTCVTFRVFSSLKCDWKRKTMHWSSLDSVLLSALQRKCVGKMGRGKINHIYITLSGWFKKKTQKDITPLSGCHESIGLATPCLLGSGLCEPTEHVHSEGQNNPEVQHSFSNLWVLGQRRTINDDIKVVGRSRQT